MYNVYNVAKYIIKRCNEHNIIISNLKLQKILYFVQAEFLVATDSPCFKERIEAWDFGPVIPTVYHLYKVYGGALIPFEEKNIDIHLSNRDKEIIDTIIDECAKYPSSKLVEITLHQTPWINSYKPYCNNEILNEDIKQYFKK